MNGDSHPHDRAIPAPPTWADARAIIERALEARAFPGAVVDVGSSSRSWWRESFGALTFEGDAPATSPSTIFDLASLTKVMATSALAMRLIDRRALDLDDPVAGRLPEWRGGDRASVTLRDLLAHCSGLPAHLRYYDGHRGRVEFQPAVCQTPLEYEPRTQSLYSDLGFMLLGFVLEDGGGAPLDRQFEAIAELVAPAPLAYVPPRAWRADTAPTEIESWRGRLIVGEVHDLNAWALGGVAGHAGLFGSAEAVAGFARLVLAALRNGDARLAQPETMRMFAQRAEVPNSTRALGWDTMKSTSSCGTRMSATAIGHTGFTGTSLWIDWERDFYAVLLTNRVYPDSSNDAILRVRPAFHDALIAGWRGAHVGRDAAAG
jgi:CubicO group peptidase (beta-lactamase class C family)